jgi:hypothetical protein
LPTYFCYIFDIFSLILQLFVGSQPCRTEELAEDLSVNVGFLDHH